MRRVIAGVPRRSCMAYPCWRDRSETSNVLFVNKPIVRVMAFCRLEDHLNPAARDVDLEIALSESFHVATMGLPGKVWQLSDIRCDPPRGRRRLPRSYCLALFYCTNPVLLQHA